MGTTAWIVVSLCNKRPPHLWGGLEKGVLLILLLVFSLALLLDIQLWLLPLFFVTFIFLSNVSHDDYSFLVGLSLQMIISTTAVRSHL